MSTEEYLTETEDYAISHWRWLVVVLWKNQTHAAHVRPIQTHIDRAAQMSDGQLALIQVVLPEAVVPDTVARQALAKMLRANNMVISHSAVIYLGSGFRAAMCRSIVTGINMLSNPGYPHRVFGSIEEGALWVGANHGKVVARDVSLKIRQLCNASRRRVSDRPSGEATITT